MIVSFNVLIIITTAICFPTIVNYTYRRPTCVSDACSIPRNIVLIVGTWSDYPITSICTVINVQLVIGSIGYCR